MRNHHQILYKVSETTISGINRVVKLDIVVEGKAINIMRNHHQILYKVSETTISGINRVVKLDIVVE
ncbi:hypothetical protein, partial [Chryseobacterium sp. CH25]|uniref:hypothetical protein n=1 Tax=Chryseobacterium sp. CH25 TaxID=713559 RepID=UPI001E499ED2